MSNSPQSFCNEAEDVFKDGNGRILTVGDVILCKGCPFIVLEDGSIGCYTTGKMNQISHTTDEEWDALEGRADKLQVERSTGFGNQVIADSLRQAETNLQKSDCRHRYPSYNQQQL